MDGYPRGSVYPAGKPHHDQHHAGLDQKDDLRSMLHRGRIQNRHLGGGMGRASRSGHRSNAQYRDEDACVSRDGSLDALLDDVRDDMSHNNNHPGNHARESYSDTVDGHQDDGKLDKPRSNRHKCSSIIPANCCCNTPFPQSSQAYDIQYTDYIDDTCRSIHFSRICHLPPILNSFCDAYLFCGPN